jgi:hypothetical protein
MHRGKANNSSVEMVGSITAGQAVVVVSQRTFRTIRGTTTKIPTVEAIPMRAELLEKIKKRLDDDDGCVRRGAQRVLMRRLFPHAVRRAIGWTLDVIDYDKGNHVADFALEVFDVCHLREVLRAIEAGESEDRITERILCIAVDALEEGRCEDSAGPSMRLVHFFHALDPLPPRVLERLVKLLEHHDADISSGAVSVLDGKSGIPENIVTHLIGRLDDPRPETRDVAARVLSHFQDLPGPAEDRLLEMLENGGRVTRIAVATGFGEPSSISETVQEKLAMLLDDEDQGVRSHAAQALFYHSECLVESVLGKLVRHLRGSDRGVTYTVMQVLCRKKPLPDTIIESICNTLNDESPYARADAIHILAERNDIARKDVYDRIVHLLHDGNAKVRSEAVRALKRFSPGQ